MLTQKKNAICVKRCFEIKEIFYVTQKHIVKLSVQFVTNKFRKLKLKHTNKHVQTLQVMTFFQITTNFLFKQKNFVSHCLCIESKKFSEQISNTSKQKIHERVEALGSNLPNLKKFALICCETLKKDATDKRKKFHKQISNHKKNKKRLRNLAKDLSVNLRPRNYIAPPPIPSSALLIQRGEQTQQIMQHISNETLQNFEQCFRIPAILPHENSNKKRRPRGKVDCR